MLFQQSWLFEIDYSKVSDIDYFTATLAEAAMATVHAQLLQVAPKQLNVLIPGCVSVLVRDFQVLTTSNNLPYRLPDASVEYNYYVSEVMEYFNYYDQSCIDIYAPTL